MPIIITMPALSPTMTEGTLAKWLLREGDAVNSGDMMAEIETDKATMEVEAVDEGILARILILEGTEGVAVNTPIAVLLEEGEDLSVLDDQVENLATEVPIAPVVERPLMNKVEPEVLDVKIAPSSDRGDRILSSPLARRMAEQAGLDVTKINGSGPRGRIVKADIEATIASAKLASEGEAGAVDKVAKLPIDRSRTAIESNLMPLDNVQKTIARRMSESKREVPHFYLTLDCELDALLTLRKNFNGSAEGSFKLSINDLVIKAAAVALMKVPGANVSFENDSIRQYKSADISVAVASSRGLITPVIKNANGKGLEAISSEMILLANKANQGKLMPEEYQGGSFSISNLGMYGIKQFDAVINTPQACILAVGVGEKRPVVKDGALAVATVMTVTLSVDHRAVDGSIGAKFLSAFKGLIEDPVTMLL